MPLTIALLTVMITALTGSLTLQNTVNTAQISAQYRLRIRAQLLAEGGLQLASVNPNIIIVNDGCTLTIQTVGSEIVSHAQCGSAQVRVYGSVTSYTVSLPLPAHCTNGYGQDGVMNPHCQPGETITSVQVRY